MVTSSHRMMCSARPTRKAVDQPGTQHLCLCLQPVAACLFKPAMLHGLTSGVTAARQAPAVIQTKRSRPAMPEL